MYSSSIQFVNRFLKIDSVAKVLTEDLILSY